MTVTDTTAPAQTNALAFDVDLRHAPEKVWRALTDPALLADWLLPAVGFDLAPGTTFTFMAPPKPGWDGTVHCRVVAVEPLRKLTYAWVVGELDTIVTFTLTPTATGTRLVIVQSGFTEGQKKNWGGARYGWNMMGNRLVDLMEKLS
jgi:uncharacterized protein YndB with AHSA1/START domain